MTTYPTQPTGDNSVDLTNIFASNSTNKIIMSTEEILEGYNNDGEASTPLTSTPDGNKFNYFWYQVHNTLVWVVNYIKALFDNKLELSGGTMSGSLNLGSNKITNLSAGTANTDAVNKLQLDTAVNGAKWLGEIWELSYPSIPVLPSGMEVAECDGRALSKTTYSTLYALIGTTYGGTEVGTTFNIPDKRGVVTRGWDHGRGLDTGRVFGSYQDSGVPNITGQFSGVGQFFAGVVNYLTGAFYRVNTSNVPTNGVTIANDGQKDDVFGLDTSLISTEYKNGLSEVRVKNTTGYFVIRIK